MKRALFLALALASGVAMAAPRSTEFVVTTSCTRFDPGPHSRAMEVQNNGENAVWCAFESEACDTGSPSRKISPGATFSFESTAMWCVAETADQSEGSATTVTEL